MIGVASQPGERGTVTEFFELCKTPWEFWRPNRAYDVVICTSDVPPAPDAKLLLMFRPDPNASAGSNGSRGAGGSVRALKFDENRVPIYGPLTTFANSQWSWVSEAGTDAPVIRINSANGFSSVQIGYNLFTEIRYLLSVGQPVGQSSYATLDLHITLLRELITRCGVPFVEIAPAPAGKAFIACLTHDIDHPVLRNHFCDRTMVGFLYRATIGSLLDFARGRKPIKHVARNWWAAIRLPFVYLGLASDPWRQFDRYVEIEDGRPSTHFVIPQPAHAGLTVDGPAPAKRASRYTPAEINPQLQHILSKGGEVGLHGLDAWRDVSIAREERDILAGVLGRTATGVRMHWLYFDSGSPSELDSAGFIYDSSVGYNTTVGYRAGTGQVYRPPGAKNLLELPLHVMDTALFYPDYMGLRESEAWSLVSQMADNAVCHGGAFTINWHDRSIFPERLWGDFYVRLVDGLQDRGAWFATAGDTVDWFKKRRAAVLEYSWSEPRQMKIRGRCQKDKLPGLKIRIHKARSGRPSDALKAATPPEIVEFDLHDAAEQTIAL